MLYKIKHTIYFFLILIFLATFFPTFGEAQDKTISYGGIEFAPTLSFLLYDDTFIEQAEVKNNIIRSPKEPIDRKVQLMLTAHLDLISHLKKYHKIENYTFGPYLLLKTNDETLVDTNTFGIGLSFGFDKVGKEKFVIGIGRYFDRRKALPSNFKINEAIPPGETEIRFVERKLDAWVITISRPF